MEWRRFHATDPAYHGIDMNFGWHDSEEIALLLTEKYPETDPLTVRFTDLHKMVSGLPGFEGDPKKSNEAILEAIQMAWHEEYQDSKG